MMHHSAITSSIHDSGSVDCSMDGAHCVGAVRAVDLHLLKLMMRHRLLLLLHVYMCLCVSMGERSRARA